MTHQFFESGPNQSLDISSWPKSYGWFGLTKLAILTPQKKRLFSTNLAFFGDFTILVISDPFDDNEFVNKGKSFEGWNEIEYTVGG